MPYASKRQARWAHATDQPFARRWDKLTSFAGLPERKDAGATAGAPVHGPGGLLSTSGLGQRKGRKGRKWGMKRQDVAGVSVRRKTYTNDASGSLPSVISAPHAGQRSTGLNLSKSNELTGSTESQRGQVPSSSPSTYVIGVDGCSMPASIAQKDVRITGNLYRADDGKFSSGNGPASAPKPPRVGRAARRTAKPKQTDAQRQEARDAKRAQNTADVAKRMADTDTGLSPSGVKALTAFAQGAQPTPEQGAGLATMGLAEQAADGSYRMTPTGRAAVAAMAAGDYRRAVDAVSRGTDAQGKRTQRQVERTARQQASAAKRQEAEAKRQARRAEVAQRRATKKPAKAASGGGKKPADKKPVEQPTKAPAKRAARSSGARMPSGGGGVAGATPEKKPRPEKAPAKQISPALTAAATAISAGDPIDPKDVQALVRNGLARLDKDGQPILTAAGLRATMKDAITVFKDHTGAMRWVARTTTAYRDRDGEIISEAALDQDSQRMMATKQFGPLRWWHVGDPDPMNAINPAGPGLDIGDCDYSVVIGRTRVESGTFRDSGIARKVAQASDNLEMSPGFFHPLDQPDAAGVFGDIRTFERSVVPIRYGRASNLFTGFTVKEFRMDINEMEKRFKAMISEIGLSAEQAATLGQDLVATEKAAASQGIAYKSDDAPPEDITINGVVYTVKAFPPKAAEPDPGATTAELKAPPVVEDVTEDVAVEAPEGEMDMEPEGDYIGDMGVEEFKMMLAELLAPVLKMQDMVKSMQDMGAELKTMYGGTATKDAGVQAEIAALKARLAEIEGDQPATILPDEVAQALKSAPAQAQEPEKPQIESTPDRPWRGWGAHTFPELYQNGENA